MTENEKQNRTAYRVETDRLVIRCWSPEDAPVLRQALDANDGHLRPMIPFMKDEPRTLRQTAQWLRGFRAAFDLGEDYRYAVFDVDEKKLLGMNMLLSRAGPGALEIGYWTDKGTIGMGVASEASSAMIRIAFDIEKVDRVEILCTPENQASAAIPAKLGFTHEATMKRRGTDSTGAILDLMIWSLFAADYPGSPAAMTQYKAYDCMGEEIT
jgi:RimJ/RimL family protein N-acetyltransferase